MTTVTREQAIENIYASLQNNNDDIDVHITALKSAIAPGKEAEFDASRLPHNNREGRKLMQSYFKKRGVIVTFKS